MTPAQVMFKRDISGPGDQQYREFPLCRVGPDSVRVDIQKRIQLASRANKARYDLHRKKVTYSAGDNVLLKTHPISNLKRKFSAKLAPSWRGPFVVLDEVSPFTFRIKSMENPKDIRIAHVEQLKYFHV